MNKLVKGLLIGFGGFFAFFVFIYLSLFLFHPSRQEPYGCFKYIGAYSLHYQDTCFNESGFYISFSNTPNTSINSEKLMDKIENANLIISLNQKEILFNRSLGLNPNKDIFIPFENNFSNREVEMGIEMSIFDENNEILYCEITDYLKRKKCK